MFWLTRRRVEVGEGFEDDVSGGTGSGHFVLILNTEELDEGRGGCAGVGEDGQRALCIDESRVGGARGRETFGLTGFNEGGDVEVPLDWGVTETREEHEPVVVHEGEWGVEDFPVPPRQLSLLQEQWGEEDF